MKKYLIYATIVLVLAFGFYKKVFIPKHTFQTLSLQSGSMDIVVNGVGNVDARNVYKIGSIYGGKVIEFSLEEGDFIKKGSLIAKIDSVDLNDKIKELEATISKLDSDIKSLKLDKKSAISNYKYQSEIYKKNEKLYRKKAISQLDFQKYTTNKEVAKLKVDSLDAKISSLYAQKKQLKASLNGLKEKLKRYSVISPIDGYVTKKFISNYSTVMPNQPLVEIVNPKDVWIATHIDTRISGKVKVGDSATIVLQSSNIKYTGKVVNINPINNSITYEREIDVKFDNLPIPFYLEEQASVNIGINTLKDVVKIPLRALSIYKKQQGVWILDKDKVIFKPINILAQTDENIATKDISTNDTLVIPNPKNKPLSNGMKIYIKR